MSAAFATVVEALSAEPGVARGKMFGAEGLTASAQVFAMEVKGCLVVKLSAERAAALRDAGLAVAFDPGHGRPMKQWVSVAHDGSVGWEELAREALAFARKR